MRAADVAQGQVFGCWEVIGPSCPEYRHGVRYVEAECWCLARYTVRADSLANGKTHRCRSCEMGRRRSLLVNRGLDAVSLRNVNAERVKKAERLALIRQVAERRQAAMSEGGA